MKKNLAALLLVSGLAAGSASATDMSALVNEGKSLMAAFGGALKAELTAAVEAGGPVNAIGVCNEVAQSMAAEASAESGWTIARSSHLLRNPENAPDAYTAAAIEDFLARQAAGEPAADLVRAEIVEEDGQQVFRMVKAIATGGACLGCHGGDQVSPEVVAKLAELYPNDEARGFSEGEMRGVFTLSRVVE